MFREVITRGREERRAHRSLENGRRPTIAIILQGLKVGGMERGAIQLARCAVGAGYDARLVLYDSPWGRSDDQYDPGEIPIAFVPRGYGVDITLPARLATLLYQWNIDIVHARNNVAGFYSAAAIALMKDDRPALIVTFDSYPGKGTAKARLASRWATRRAARVTSVSEELSARLVTSGWTCKSDTIWNGADPQQFTPSGPTYGLREHFNMSNTTLLVGQIARFDENKRQVDLIEAIRLVRNELPNVRLILAGDGASRWKIQRLVDSTNNVWVIPRATDIAALLRELDIFVLCSLDEGAPRALLEAMFCEKAIIATDVGGIPHILQDCGILVPPSRPDLLAESIRRLGVSRGLRAQLGALARNRALDSFTMEREWRQYADIYESVLARRTGHAKNLGAD